MPKPTPACQLPYSTVADGMRFPGPSYDEEDVGAGCRFGSRRPDKSSRVGWMIAGTGTSQGSATMWQRVRHAAVVGTTFFLLASSVLQARPVHKQALADYFGPF